MVGMSMLTVLFALLGLAFGSFGNVLILRIRKAEVLSGRSACPHCRTPIAWYDLVPVLSFVLLRGRCRTCESRISFQYPLVETGSVLLFVAAMSLASGDPVRAFGIAFALYFLFLACVYDGMYQQIPDLFTALFSVAALIDVVMSNADVVSHVEGALVPLLWFGLQWVVSRGRAVGSGDILLGSAIGLWLGLFNAGVMLVLSYMIGAIVVVFLLLVKKIPKKRERIAFGPFMGIATILTLLGAGDLYLSLLK